MPPGTLVGGVTSILSVVVSLLLSPPQSQVQLLSITRVSGQAQAQLGELAPRTL